MVVALQHDGIHAKTHCPLEARVLPIGLQGVADLGAALRSGGVDVGNRAARTRLDWLELCHTLFRGDLQAQYKRLLVGGSVRYNSHVRNIDQAFVYLDDLGLLPTGIHGWMDTHKTGDVIVDARIGVELLDQLRISFIVNNLTNKTYSMRPLSVEAPRSMQVQMALSL